MPSTLWSAPVGPLGSTSGPSLTNLTPAQDGSPVPPVIVPVGLLSVGTEIRIRAHGEYTCSSATPTMTFGFYWGGVGGVALATGVTPVLSASAAAWPWMAEWDGEIRAMSTVAGGSTGSVNGQGKLHLGSSLTAFATPIAFPSTKALRTVAIDTSVSKVVSFGAFFSSATGTPSVICDDLIVELLG